MMNARRTTQPVPGIPSATRASRPRGRRAGGAGFTLIEILLAVAVFAIVLLGVNTVFYSALRLERSTHRLLDERLPLNHALATLRRDLQGAVQPDSNGVFICDYKSGAARGGFASSPSGSLEFCTTTGRPGKDAPWADLQRVKYELTEPTNAAAGGGMDLVRVVTRNLLPVTTEETDEQWLMGGIESVEFLGYNGTEWRDTWDSSSGDAGLPQAVRVRVQLALPENRKTTRREPLELFVPLTTQARTNPVTGGFQ
jgi:general secretion pathway protein J